MEAGRTAVGRKGEDIIFQATAHPLVLGCGLWSLHGLDLKRFPCRLCMFPFTMFHQDKTYCEFLRLITHPGKQTRFSWSFSLLWPNMTAADNTVFVLHPLGNPLRSSQHNGTVHAISGLNKFNTSIRDEQLHVSLKSVANRLSDSDCGLPHSQFLLYDCHTGACSGDWGSHSTDGEQ